MKETLCLIFAVLQIADALTTLKILSNGGSELNPVMRWIFTKLGTVNGLMVVKCSVILLFYAAMPYIPVWVYVLMVALYTYVVFHNIRQIYK